MSKKWGDGSLRREGYSSLLIPLERLSRGYIGFQLPESALTLPLVVPAT